MNDSGMEEAVIFKFKLGKRIAYGLRFINRPGRPSIGSSRWATLDCARTFASVHGITIVGASEKK